MIGIPDDEWGEAVKAVVVMKPGESATEADIIEVLPRNILHLTKNQNRVDFVESLPKAPTGKDPKTRTTRPLLEPPGEKSLNVKFFIGQQIDHNRFSYRGLIYDVDSDFQGNG